VEWVENMLHKAPESARTVQDRARRHRCRPRAQAPAAPEAACARCDVGAMESVMGRNLRVGQLVSDLASSLRGWHFLSFPVLAIINQARRALYG
jgi:hypothetical protein